MPRVERVAAALLVRDGRVLLGHRHPARRNYPDCWDLPGGHVEPGETDVECVVRECREELGIEIADPRPAGFTLADPLVDCRTFVVTHWAGDVRNCAPDEHDDLRWFAADEIPGLTLADPSYVTAIPEAIRTASPSA